MTREQHLWKCPRCGREYMLDSGLTSTHYYCVERGCLDPERGVRMSRLELMGADSKDS